MLKKWLNKRGFKNIFYYIAGIHSPSLVFMYGVNLDKKSKIKP